MNAARTGRAEGTKFTAAALPEQPDRDGQPDYRLPGQLTWALRPGLAGAHARYHALLLWGVRGEGSPVQDNRGGLPPPRSEPFSSPPPRPVAPRPVLALARCCLRAPRS